MTDVPPGTDGPGADADPYVPAGVRRSSYTPLGSTDAADFDDDALAEAMAAEVAAYTSPISIVPPAAPEPAVPDAVASDAVAPEPASDVPASEGETSRSSTLEAIARLESELQRRAEEARAVGGPISAPVASLPLNESPVEATHPVEAPHPGEAPDHGESTEPEAHLFPAPPTFLRPSPPEEVAPPADPPAWAPSAFTEPPPPTSEAPPFAPPPPLVEPAFGPPPPLVEPPAPATIEAAPPAPFVSFGPPPSTFAMPPAVFGAPSADAAVDLPPPAIADLAHLPPPIGVEPVPITPYEPPSELSPEVRVPMPHPDDLAPSVSDSEAVADPWTDDDDVVDDVDRVVGAAPIAGGSTEAVSVIAPPSQPIPTVRLADDEPALVDESPQSHPPLLIESAGAEPTALDLRAGRAARLFWMWFAVNSSVVSLSVGAVLFGLGMSLRQALVAIFLGVALSCLPLGLSTLAGKWSGQPTMVVSRATFGLTGNALPAALAVISRVFWGGALLWVLAAGVAAVLVDAGLDAGLGEQVWTVVGLGAGFAIAFVVALFGYGLMARVQLALSVVTGVLVIGVVALTFPRLNLAAAQSIDDGPWTLLLTGVVLVFSFVGLAWVHSGADVARYQRPGGDGGSTMLWAIFGATLPALILVAWGALLAASDPLIADGLATNPLYTIAALLPLWYPAPLIAALALGLLSGTVLTIYSGGFALQSLGVPARRVVTTAIAGGLVLVAAAVLLLIVGNARELIVDVATTLAVPVAAWAGIFGAEIMIRRRGFDAGSLVSPDGIYPAVRWPNLIGLVVISAIGFGLTSGALPGLGWQGYLLPVFGLPDGDPLLTSDVGVLVALVLGILLPLATAVSTIRRQERALVDSTDDH